MKKASRKPQPKKPSSSKAPKAAAPNMKTRATPVTDAIPLPTWVWPIFVLALGWVVYEGLTMLGWIGTAVEAP